MKAKPKVKTTYDEPVPQFAQNRVEDLFSAWHPNFISLKDFVTSVYLQGVADGWQCGEQFTFPTEKVITTCQAGRDGDCIHELCPQVKDGEPAATGRHCPLDTMSDDE